MTKAESLTGASHTKLASEVSAGRDQRSHPGAVHEAVARESADRPRLALGPSSGRAHRKQTAAENDRSDSGQSRAAAQSQQGQNQAVSQANRMARARAKSS